MKKFKLFMLFTLCAVIAQAQFIATRDYFSTGPGVSMGDKQYPPPARSKVNPNVDNSELENRFFIDSTFREGEVKIKTDVYTTEMTYRFDQMHNRIEVRFANGNKTYLSNVDIVYSKIYYKNDTIVFVPFALSPSPSKTLLNVVYKTPTLQLYCDLYKSAQFSRSTGNDPYGSSNNFSAHLEKGYQYYIRKNDGDSFNVVDISSESFIKALPEKSKQITELFKGKRKKDLTLSDLAEIMKQLDVQSMQ
jgi:hypothetical protein